MTAPSVTFDGTRLSSADSVTDGGSWDKWDASQNPTVEPDILYEGSNELSVKVGATSADGVEFFAFTGGTVDFATTPKVWLAKTIVTNYAALDAQGATGHILYVGSATTTNRMLYYTHGNDNYPLKGGWIFNLINPNLTYEDTEEGTLDQTAVDYFAVSAEFSASSKVENLVISAIDYFDVGTGLTLIGGDGASADAVFEDFRVYEEDTATNRHGIVSSTEGILFVLGMLTIGSATETDFTDATAGTMVFSDGRFGAGSTGVVADLSNANSVFSCTGWSFVGRGNTTTADSRPDFSFSGTTSTVGGEYIGCSFRNFRNWTMTSKGTLTDCILADGNLLTQAGGTVVGATVSGTTQGDNAAFLVSDDIESITDSTFAFSDGHAIELDSTHTAAGGPYDMSGIEFTGSFGGTPGSNLVASTGSSDAMIYNSSGEDLTINIIGGGTVPSVRNAASSTTTIVSGTVTTTINVSDNNGDALNGARVLVRSAGTPRPHDFTITVTRAGTVATAAHTAHGYVTGNKVEINGITDKVDDNGVRTIASTPTADTYTWTTTDSGSTSYTGTILETAVFIDGTTSGGTIADTRAFASDQAVDGYVRDSSSSPFFKSFNLAGNTIDSASGLTVNIRMQLDE